MILSLLNVNKFNSFQFVDYEDCRRVVIDGNEYNFDNEFHHNDSNATQILCTIDCLIADLEEDNIEAILKKIEKKINLHLQKWDVTHLIAFLPPFTHRYTALSQKTNLFKVRFFLFQSKNPPVLPGEGKAALVKKASWKQAPNI